MNTKYFRTVTLLLALIFPVILWTTRLEWLNSLSAFDNQPNAIWYRLMHCTMLIHFTAMASYYKENLYWWLCFGVVMILGADMYNWYGLHVIFTVATMALGVFTILYIADKKERIIRGIVSTIGAGIIITSYLTTDIHFLVGEWIIMATISFGLIRQIWKK